MFLAIITAFVLGTMMGVLKHYKVKNSSNSARFNLPASSSQIPKPKSKINPARFRFAKSPPPLSVLQSVLTKGSASSSSSSSSPPQFPPSQPSRSFDRSKDPKPSLPKPSKQTASKTFDWKQAVKELKQDRFRP